MDDKLLINTLETLEETYPEKYHIGKLVNKLGTSLNGEFFKIVKYLKESKKIELIYLNKDPQEVRERLYVGDMIGINNDGIDFLKECKLQLSNERMNQSIKWATVIIALSALSGFIFNLKSGITITDVPVIVVIGIIICIGLVKMIDPLSGRKIRKK